MIKSIITRWLVRLAMALSLVACGAPATPAPVTPEPFVIDPNRVNCFEDGRFQVYWNKPKFDFEATGLVVNVDDKGYVHDGGWKGANDVAAELAPASDNYMFEKTDTGSGSYEVWVVAHSDGWSQKSETPHLTVTCARKGDAVLKTVTPAPTATATRIPPAFNGLGAEYLSNIQVPAWTELDGKAQIGSYTLNEYGGHCPELLNGASVPYQLLLRQPNNDNARVLFQLEESGTTIKAVLQTAIDVTRWNESKPYVVTSSKTVLVVHSVEGLIYLKPPAEVCGHWSYFGPIRQ